MTAEEIFNNSAQENMVKWSLNDFKRTHLSLYISILEAIERAKNSAKRGIDLNKCTQCEQELALGASGTIVCLNDECEVEVVGMMYKEPITIEEQSLKINKIYGGK